MDKVRMVFVGCGWISEWHYDGIKKCDEITLVGIYDPVKEIVDKRAKEWNVKSYEEFEKILEDPDVDAIAVFSPSYLHYRQAIEILDAGKHVLVEKPVGLTPEAIELMQTKAQEVKRIIFPSHNFVYRPAVRRALEFIKEGKLGEISWCSFRAIHFIPPEASAGWRKKLKYSQSSKE